MLAKVKIKVSEPHVSFKETITYCDLKDISKLKNIQKESTQKAAQIEDDEEGKKEFEEEDVEERVTDTGESEQFIDRYQAKRDKNKKINFKKKEDANKTIKIANRGKNQVKVKKLNIVNLNNKLNICKTLLPN